MLQMEAIHLGISRNQGWLYAARARRALLGEWQWAYRVPPLMREWGTALPGRPRKWWGAVEKFDREKFTQINRCHR